MFSPEDFIEHRGSTAFVSSDAVPVYLDVSTGNILVDMMHAVSLPVETPVAPNSSLVFSGTILELTYTPDNIPVGGVIDRGRRRIVAHA